MGHDLKNSNNTGLIIGIVAGVAVLLIVWDATRDRSVDDRKALRARETTMKQLEKEQRELAQKIKAHAGQGRCNADEDCHVVGIGAISCDKYINFLFYSSLDADSAALKMDLSTFNKNQSKLMDLSLAVAPCGTDMPEVACVQGRCADPTKVPIKRSSEGSQGNSEEESSEYSR